jgi:hypothetical protein
MWMHLNSLNRHTGADLYLMGLGDNYQAMYFGHKLPCVSFNIHIWEQEYDVIFDCYPPSGNIKLRGKLEDIPTMIAQVMLVAG